MEWWLMGGSWFGVVLAAAGWIVSGCCIKRRPQRRTGNPADSTTMQSTAPKSLGTMQSGRISDRRHPPPPAVKRVSGGKQQTTETKERKMSSAEAPTSAVSAGTQGSGAAAPVALLETGAETTGRSAGSETISFPSAGSAGSNSGGENEAAAQLSEYESLKEKGHKASPLGRLPDVPEASERDDSQGRKNPKKLSFNRKGRVKVVPRDQAKPWGVRRSRLVVNPDRREHVLQTFAQSGGWLIDRSVPTPKNTPPNYIYHPPSSSVTNSTRSLPDSSTAPSSTPPSTNPPNPTKTPTPNP